MRSNTRLSLIAFGVIGMAAVSFSAQASPASNAPPEAVMNKFYGYLQRYNLWLGDDRGACAYEVDPAVVKKDGDDRFFMAKISRGRAGTACRGVLDFEFVRQQNEDIRFAGWERYQPTLYDPTSNVIKNRSSQAVKAICAL